MSTCNYKFEINYVAILVEVACLNLIIYLEMSTEKTFTKVPEKRVCICIRDQLRKLEMAFLI